MFKRASLSGPFEVQPFPEIMGLESSGNTCSSLGMLSFTGFSECVGVLLHAVSELGGQSST